MRLSTPLLLASLVFSGTAYASSIFPGVIQEKTGRFYNCDTCHTDLGGGYGTVTKPFGVTLMANGAEAANRISLEAALEAIRAKGTDSDDDGTPDYEELTAGRNPNRADAAASPDAGTNPGGGGNVVDPVPNPSYGCSATAGGGAMTGLLFAGAALASALRRRRR
jgi:hypothetical protein